MPPESFTEWLGRLNQEIAQTNQCYPHNLIPGWPIPFFGDISSARVLTVGVNPSNQEFSAHRQWHAVTNLEDWQKRLVNYFTNPDVRPWIWFEVWSICLTLLDLGYLAGGAAHVDISPRPTRPMLDPNTDAAEFRKMAESDVKWFFELLDKLPRIQLLLVAGPIPRADGRKQQLADFISDQAQAHGAHWAEDAPLPRLITSVHSEGIPVFICPFEPDVDGLYAMVRQIHRNRELLRRLSTPQMRSPPQSDWAFFIGNFLLNFGTLDYLVFVFLKDHLLLEEFEDVRKWHFKDRVDRIAQYLKDAKYPSARQSLFARMVERLNPVRDLRNHVAHGHMYSHLDMKSKQPKVTIFKAKDLDAGHLPDSKHVEFSELIKTSSALTELIEEFKELAGFRDDTNTAL